MSYEAPRVIFESEITPAAAKWVCLVAKFLVQATRRPSLSQELLVVALRDSSRVRKDRG